MKVAQTRFEPMTHQFERRPLDIALEHYRKAHVGSFATPVK